MSEILAQSFNPLNQMHPDGSVVSDKEREAWQLATIAAQAEYIREYIRRMKAPQFPNFATSGELLSYVIQRGMHLMRLEEERAFVLDGNNLDVYQQLAGYFTGDKQTFPCDLDSRKGLLVFGRLGCGKSLLMRLFGQNPRQSFRIVSSRAIAEDYRSNNDLCHLKATITNQCSAKFFGQSTLGLCIDDVGAESVTSSFGNSRNVIAELIQDRYDNHQLRGPMTHIVTNATPDELRDSYGPRVYDRLRQLFNIVEFPEQPTRRS